MFRSPVLIVATLLLIGLLLVIGRYFSLWLRGYVTRARIGLPSLVFMSLRRVSPQAILDAKIMAAQAGLTESSTNALEAHYLAGGDVKRVTQALIAAQRARIELNWDTAAAIDLAGRNILEAVQVSVNPIVIDCPDPRNGQGATLNGVAKDGIQLKVRVRVTKEVYDKLQTFREVIDDCEVLRPILWGLEVPPLAEPPTGPGGSANVKMNRLLVPIETDKWSMLRRSIQELRAIYNALMKAGHTE